MKGRENLCCNSVVCAQEGIVFEEILFIYLKTVQQYLLNTQYFLSTEHVMQSEIDLLAILMMLKIEIGRLEGGCG